MNKQEFLKMSRRELLKLGAMSGGAALIGSAVPGFGPIRAFGQEESEPFPTSPLILEPWKDELPIPTPLAPISETEIAGWPLALQPGKYKQDCDGGVHQYWEGETLPDYSTVRHPVYYRIPLQVAPHSFSKSKVQTVVPYFKLNGDYVPAGTIVSSLPDSTIYGFNGTFPGPMINAVYGQPACVRFVNELDQNPHNLDRMDFGVPEFLTHLHNGHTASESDGNPNHKPGAYVEPGDWCDNLYLNWAAGGDPREKQSFMWFHDHRMDHTGANVYKGMVGLYPIYDPILDPGDETRGLHLPGVPTKFPDGSIDYTQPIKYDIPLAFYDCALDDGAVGHKDFHNGSGEPHPEWWGKSFFRHYPNHGFVGDVFTVNGKAFPVLEVKRRKYRLRFLDASIARLYEFKLMKGEIAAFPGQQGQYNFVTTRGKGGKTQKTLGEQCMQFTQIASEGGLLPKIQIRDSFQIWPAKRREFIVDFTKYQDGSPTRKGDEIYLANILQMSNGRKPTDRKDLDFDPNYCVPVLKIVIGDDPPEPDNSLIPKANQILRELPPIPDTATLKTLTNRTFTLSRSGTFGGEIQWLINDHEFVPNVPLAYVPQGAQELWTIVNGGGGWVHPLHLHMEEHQVISRNGKPAPDLLHPDDRSREDVVALEPSESVTVYRQFRSFKGHYVAHCHNLAHEDHAMMFGWDIV